MAGNHTHESELINTTRHAIPIEYLPRVELGQEEIADVLQNAAAKNEKYENGNLYSDGGVVLGENSSLSLWQKGAICEHAVAKHQGAQYDDTVFVDDVDDGSDLDLPEIGTTDVKGANASVSFDTLSLLVMEKDDPSDYADAYVLTQYNDDFSEVTLVGYATREDVLESEPVDWPPNKPDRPHDNHRIPADELRPIPLNGGE